MSHSSILSIDLIKSNATSELRQSTVKPVDKRVTLWTPVVISGKFPTQVIPTRLDYRTGDTLFKTDYPTYIKDIVGGLIIRLPLTDIEDMIPTIVNKEQLSPDEQLIDFLTKKVISWRQ